MGLRTDMWPMSKHGSQPRFSYDPCACRLSPGLYGVEEIPQDIVEQPANHVPTPPLAPEEIDCRFWGGDRAENP